MITVSIDLNGVEEVSAFSQFLLQLEQYRASTLVVAQPQVTPAPTEVSPPTPVQADPAVIADISPDSVERQFREFIHSKGTAAARQLLDKYQLQHLKDLPASKRAAFVAELSV